MKPSFSPPTINTNRRTVLRRGLTGLGVFVSGPVLWAIPGVARADLTNLGPLSDPDANGLRLPAGFRSRIVARSGLPPRSGGAYRWHGAPDGGGVFAVSDGG